MSLTKDSAERLGAAFGPEPEDYRQQYEEARQQDILECARALVAMRKAIDLICLRGAELADGAVRRAFIDCGVLVQSGIQRLDREFNLIETEPT